MASVGTDLQAMRDQVRELERLADADKEDFESINNAMQKAIVATQNASLSMHTLNNRRGSGGRPSPRTVGGMPPLCQSGTSPQGSANNRVVSGMGSQQTSLESTGSSNGVAPKPPPRQYNGSSGRPGQSNPIRRASGGGGAPDPVLVESLVATLVGDGVSMDMATAAVQGTGGSSLEAARRWIASSGSAGGGGRALRTIRQLRALDAGTVETAGASGVPRTFGATAGVGISPIRGTRNPCNVNPAGAESTAPSLMGSRQQSTTSAGGDERSFAWCVPSPVKQHTSAPTVQLQIRCQGGKLVSLVRLFYPSDSLKAVLHELIRQHSEDVVPVGQLDTSQTAFQSAYFTVPFPRAKYTWGQMDTTTVEAAGLGTRGTLIFTFEA